MVSYSKEGVGLLCPLSMLKYLSRQTRLITTLMCLWNYDVYAKVIKK
jgi:hypothetical protein